MSKIDSTQEEMWSRDEARRIARMSPEEYIVKSRPWSSEMQKRVSEASDRLTANAPQPLASTLEDYYKNLGDGSRQFEGLRTGIDKIDHLIGGLNRFVLLAARGGAGKSTLAVQIALGVAATEGVPIIYYSFEMDADNIRTMMMQNLRKDHGYKLTRNEVVLYGNKPISSDSANALVESQSELNEIAPLFYVIDTRSGEPNLERMEHDIEYVTKTHERAPLVIIDSIQDLVRPDGNGATVAESQTAQRIVEVQQSTGATFLAISQKAKGGNVDDPYAGILGSVSLIHKPTTVVELRSVYDLIRTVRDPAQATIYRKLADSSDIPRPVVMSVIKGRNNGYGNVCLKHYGKHSYFEEGYIDHYHTGALSLYAINGVGE